MAKRSRKIIPLGVSMLGALPPWRGVSAYTSELVRALAARQDIALEFLGFNALYPKLLYPGGDPTEAARPRLSIPNIEVRRALSWYNPLSWIWAGLTFQGAVLHVQWWSYALAPVYLTVMALARLRGRPVLLTLHNVRPHEGGRIQRLLNEAVLRFAHHFVVHTRNSADTLLRVYPRAEGHLSIVPHGLLLLVGRNGVSRVKARALLGVPQNRIVLLAFGNIRPYKGVDVLLKSLRKVLDAGHDVGLVIAGQPWGSFRPYEQIINDLDLRDHVDTRLTYQSDEDVELLFSACDVAVFPYKDFDAQSGAASLALGFGVPIVVTDVGGLTEIADDHAVVPPNDVQSLADVLQEMAAHKALCSKLASHSRAVAKSLDWEVIAEETADLYRSLAPRNRTVGPLVRRSVHWR